MSEPEFRSAFGQFVAEMRRRHVVRFSLGYAAAAFVVLQLAEIVFPAFGIGEAGLRVLVILVALGFPPAAVLAWVFDITAGGIRRTSGGAADGIVPRLALLAVTVGAMGIVGVWLFVVGAFAPDERPSATGGSAPVQLATYVPGTPIRSIAVLPLQDFSPEGGQEYLAAGLHEELVAKLSQLSGVRVVSRTSAMRYAGTTLSSPDIGRELNVEALIEGSVTRAGDQIRITLQIIHAPSDSHIRTLQFDRQLTDLLALQSDIALAVVNEIQSEYDEATFTRTTMSAEPVAQQAYLRGRLAYEQGTPESYRTALSYFRDALEADPDFAAAMAGTAGAKFIMGLEDPEASQTAMTDARTDAVHALQMDSTSIEALEVLTLIERSLPRLSGLALPSETGTGATHVLMLPKPGSTDSLAIDLQAFDTTWASALTGLGERIEESVRRRANNRERPAADRGALDARQLMGSGRFDEAAALLEDVVSSTPSASRAWQSLARAYMSEGDVGAAAAAMSRWEQSGAEGAPDPGSVDRLESRVVAEGAQGYWSWTLDRLEKLRGEGGDVSRVDLAAAYAGLGQVDEAFELLSAAVEQGEPGVLTLQSDPVWDGLRGDERFRALARQARMLRFTPTLRRPTSPGGR